MKHFTKKKFALFSALFCAAALSAAVGVRALITNERAAEKERPCSAGATAPRRLVEPAVETKKTSENTDGEEILLFEDFSGFSDGSEEAPGVYVPEDYEENYMSYYMVPGRVPDAMTSKPGWGARGVRQAGGAAYLGDPLLKQPILSLPVGNYFGKLKLSFRIKNVNPDSKNTIFVFFGEDDMPRELIAPGDWQEVTFEFNNTSEAPDYSIAFTCYTYSKDGLGFLIDDVKLTRNLDFTVTPANPLALGFNEDGFTAWWNPACQADHYLVNLWEEVQTSEGDVEVKESFSDFEDWDGFILMTDGWSVDGNDVELSPDGADGTQGVVLYESNQNLIWEGTGGRVMDFSIFVKALQIADVPSEDRFVDPYFAIMGYNDEGWDCLGTISLSDIPADGGILALSQFIQPGSNPVGKFTKYSVLAKYFEHGDKLLIDDAYFKTTPATSRTLIKENVKAEENKLVFDGLDPWNEYYFNVTSVTAKGTKSAPTVITHAFGIAAPKVSDASDVEARGAYTANWETTPKAESYIVKNYQSKEIRESQSDYMVLQETFSSGKGDGDLVNVGGGNVFVSLDEFTDNSGWTAYHGCMADGMVGARGDYNELRTPELTLDHNDGEFKVRISVAGAKGDQLVVQSYDQYSIIEFNGEPDALGLVHMEGSMTFTDGQRHEMISMYTVYGGAFVVDDFEVMQDVTKGDRIMTLVDEKELDRNTLSHRFSGLKRTDEYDYSFCVTARRNWYDGSSVSSDPSSDKIVMLSNAVTEMETDGISIYSEEGNIIVDLAEDADIIVADVTGRILCLRHGRAGRNVVSSDNGKICIVKVLDREVKLIVR